MTQTPEDVAMRIRAIQQSLVDLQRQVIQGAVKPADYRRIERERIEEIHRLEAELAALLGAAPPERRPGGQG